MSLALMQIVYDYKEVVVGRTRGKIVTSVLLCAAVVHSRKHVHVSILTSELGESISLRVGLGLYVLCVSCIIFP